MSVLVASACFSGKSLAKNLAYFDSQWLREQDCRQVMQAESWKSTIWIWGQRICPLDKPKVMW